MATYKPKKQKHPLRVFGAAVAVCALLAAAGVWVFARGAKPAAVRTPPPPVQPNVPNKTAPTASFARKGDGGAIDTSNAADGYILARCKTQREARLVLETDDERRNEYLPPDGEWHAYPLTLGNCEYSARICLNKNGDWYDIVLETAFYSAAGDPAAESSMDRFLVPNHFVPYTESDAVVELAHEIYAQTETETDVADEAFQWVNRNIRYDDSLTFDETGARLTGFYLPDFDRVLEDGTGICSDYASLFAAILRVDGIPCQVVYGDVETSGGVRPHAWAVAWLPDEAGTYRWWRFDPQYGLRPASYHETCAVSGAPAETSRYGEAEQIH